MSVSCIVLAGGKSSRLGRNKLAETIDGKSLLERVLSCLAALETEIIIVTAKDSRVPKLTGHFNIKLIQDVYPGKGSLGGIYSGLAASKAFYNLVVACDMPFLNVELLRYLVGLAENYDAVVPKINNILEPLHSVYSRRCMPSLEFLIGQNKLSILELFPLVKVKLVGEAEIERFDPQHLSFFNINTEADLLVGKELVKKEGSIHDKS